MKIYISDSLGNGVVIPEAEIVFKKSEFDVWMRSLLEFQSEISSYVEKNKGKTEKLGSCHLHYQDCDVSREGEEDLVFYVDLDN